MARPRRGEIRTRLAEYRARVGLTQDEVAETLGITAEMVRRHEHGLSMPIPTYRRGYAQLFGVSEARLWLRGDGADVQQLALAQPAPAPALAPSLLPPVPPLLPDFADGDYLDAVHAHTRQIVNLDNRFGGTELVRLSVRFFDNLLDHIGMGTYDPVLERDLQVAAGELAEVVGWIAYDADEHDLVRRMNQESLYFTRLSGDRSMELLTLQNASMHAGALGRPGEALHLANSVLEGGCRLSPRLRELFLTRKARALAQRGDGEGLKLFGQIQSLYLAGVSDDDPPWAWWVDERELAWHEAMAQRDLDETGRGLEEFEHSVEATAPSETRSQYLHRGYMLQAQVEMKAWTDAESTLRDLLPLARAVASTRTVVLLRKVLRRLDDRSLIIPSSVLERGTQLAAALNSAPYDARRGD